MIPESFSLIKRLSVLDICHHLVIWVFLNKNIKIGENGIENKKSIWSRIEQIIKLKESITI